MLSLLFSIAIIVILWKLLMMFLFGVGMFLFGIIGLIIKLFSKSEKEDIR